jgi:hypothetical protein
MTSPSALRQKVWRQPRNSNELMELISSELPKPTGAAVLLETADHPLRNIHKSPRIENWTITVTGAPGDYS